MHLILNEPRRGLSLVELLLAITVVTILAASLAGLASGVHNANQHAAGRALTAQHARIALLRIENAVRRAHVSPNFPGCISVAETQGSFSFPDTLVVWAPAGTPADPLGLPRWNELVVFAPDPSAPNRLLEFRVSSANGAVPSATDTTAWRAAIASFKTADTAQKTEITALLRTASTGAAVTQPRGCVRFEITYRPDDATLLAGLTGGLPWGEVPWVRDQFGPRRGVRQVWCRMELQLVPPGPGDPAQTSVPYFGSAARYYTVER